MSKRRKKFKKPRHRMRTVFDWGGGKEKPINHGTIAETNQHPKVGPLDLNTSDKTIHHNKSSRLIHPPHSPFGSIRPPSTLRPADFYPPRFLGTPAGRHEAELSSSKLKLRVEPVFKWLFHGEHRQVRLWFTAGGKQCVIVETDTIARYRRESMIYSSLLVAETNYLTDRVTWETTQVYPLSKEKAD